MAARTASVSGKWSQTATWGGSAVPVDGDTFVINSGISVEMDADTSGFASGLGASTINGTLFFSRTAGTYYLKMNANLTVSNTGTLDASDGSNGQYPSNCYATIKFSTTFGISTSGVGAVISLRGRAPSHAYAKLTVAASAAATVLTIDTDLTAGGDSFIWKNPYLVRIDDINQAVESEQYTISSISATQITLTGGLSNAKSIGAYIILVSSNVDVVGAGTAAGTGIGGSIPTVVPILGAIRDFNVGSGYASGSLVISGCSAGISAVNGIGGTATTITGCTSGLSSTASCTVNLISGCSTGVNGATGCVVTTISGCNNGLNISPNNFIGTITGCTTGIASASFISGDQMANITLTLNTRDINGMESGTFFNTLMNSATEFLSYASSGRSIIAEVHSFDHDQSAGAYRGWCRGGIVSSVASPVFDASRPRSYQHACETGPTINGSTANNYVFKTVDVLVPAGASLFVRCYVQKDASMSYLPRLWVFAATVEPLVSGSPDAEVIMTNSTNTWEILEATVTNTTNGDKMYKVRTLAKNGSGNAYFDPIIRQSSFQPNFGMVGGMVA